MNSDQNQQLGFFVRDTHNENPNPARTVREWMALAQQQLEFSITLQAMRRTLENASVPHRAPNCRTSATDRATREAMRHKLDRLISRIERIEQALDL